MASPVYLWDGSAQDDSDATWNSSTIAYLTLTSALAAVDANGIIYVASEHVESSAANYTFGSANGNITIISVDKDSSDAYLPMRSDGAPGSIGNTGGADMYFTISDKYNGVTFSTGDNMNCATNDVVTEFIDCKISVADIFFFGSSDQSGGAIFEDVIYEQTTEGQFLSTGHGGLLEWRGGQYSWNGGSVPTELFNLQTGGRLIVEDVDIQDLDAGDYLVEANPDITTVFFKRCKVPAALGGLLTGTPTTKCFEANFHSVSNSDVIYQFQENYYLGQINEDTGIYLDATYDGTNGYSAKMASNANAKEWTQPLKFKLASFWASANPTLTVELVIDDATALNDDDFWIEIEYPDGTTGALGSVDKTSRMTNVTDSPSALTSSSVSWTGTGGMGDEQKRKVAVTIANGQAGRHTVWACLAKPSLLVYVDPKIIIT